MNRKISKKYYIILVSSPRILDIILAYQILHFNFALHFDYAYVFPGMNKMLQAGGRLIRSERDRGSLVLVLPEEREIS
nr:helicase C-terminal domain-containing protein [Paenibacillus sp. OAS669]